MNLQVACGPGPIFAGFEYELLRRHGDLLGEDFSSALFHTKRFLTFSLGGCNNHGPFLDPHYNTAPNT